MSVAQVETFVVAPICPACHGSLDDASVCKECGTEYTSVAGIPDLRVASDRYLSLEVERAKARRLAEVAAQPGANVLRVAEAYYDLTDDVVDHRRERFLKHIAGAVCRGEVLARALPQWGTTLEVGCGTGGLLVAAARTGRQVVGVDIASRWLQVARRRLDDHGLDVPLYAACAERLPWSDASFDCVVSDSVLEHLDEPGVALTEWQRVLKPGGRLLVWGPNRFSIATDPHVGLWGVGWLPRPWVPTYLRWRGRKDWPPRTLSAPECAHLARESGWESVEVDPPSISQKWARTRSRRERIAIDAYATLRGLPVSRQLLRLVGPLWELRALAPGGRP